MGGTGSSGRRKPRGGKSVGGTGGGGGGSLGGGGGGGGTPPQSECDLLFAATLQRPNAAVLSGLGVGSMLRVEHQRPGAFDIVVCIDPATGQVAGSITSDELATLIECLKRRVAYVARVTLVADRRCDVLVSRAGGSP